MKDYRREFIDFAIDRQVLRFGEFTLKSGRTSPYYFNFGLFNTGSALAKLGQYFAQALVDSGIECDVILGPAYKGIPLATTMAVALSEQHGIDMPYAFNRKEAKAHGEGGSIVWLVVRNRAPQKGGPGNTGLERGDPPCPCQSCSSGRVSLWLGN